MDRMIAYCGLVCSECEALIATQANDWEALERMAARTREEFNMPGVTAESVQCDGCPSGSDRLCGYCYDCAVRACALSRGVVTCAHCDDYGCATLETFLGMATQARSTLEAIRAGRAV
ncbi:MAG: DUF3795 domain-containing protein [Anaerolineae bacterium]